MRIERIWAEGFPPFGKLDLTLQKPERSTDGPVLGEVQIFAGPNGTGKSRILCGIAACAGYLEPMSLRMGSVPGQGNFSIVGLPVINLVQGRYTDEKEAERIKDLMSRREAFIGLDTKTLRGRLAVRPAPEVLVYARSPSAWLTHSPVSFLQSVPTPSDAVRLGFTPEPGYAKDLLQMIANVKARSLNDFQKHMGRPGTRLSKVEELIGTIERELSDFFGVRVFFRTDAETSSLLVDWGEVQEMTFNQAPDGFRSVVGWLVDIIMMTHLLRPESPNPMQEEMVILLDEPETHLHPSWQRKIIPLAQKLLPRAQMLVATHSPFVISSVNEGWIHRLEPQSDGSVKALKAEKARPGDSYPFVTEFYMGVPEWFDPESEGLIREFQATKQQALAGDTEARERAVDQLRKLAARGEELRGIAAEELAQLEDLLPLAEEKPKKPAGKSTKRAKASA